MGIRVTPVMLQRTVLSDLDRARVRLARTQEQASSGLRVNRPSDDPIAAAAALVLRADLASVAQWERNLGRAEARVAASDQSLQEAVDVLIRARELAIQGANGSLDAESRRLVAAEVEALHGRLLATANARSGGAHLFSGFASTTPPFSASGPFVGGSPPPGVAFAGDSNEVRVEIDDGVLLPTGFDGRRVFLGDADGDGAPDPGRENLFEVLGALWWGLMNDDQVAAGDAIARIDAAQEQVQVERARAGARLTRLDSARDALARREVELQSRLSEAQDADSVRVFSDLVQQETALHASLEAAARVLPPSLLDFLR